MGYEGLLKMLDVLLSEETEGPDKQHTFQEEFGIAMTKKMEGDVLRMCNLSKGVYDRAVIDAIKKMMKNTGWDIEECMDTLEIPDEKRSKYKAVISGETIPV